MPQLRTRLAVLALGLVVILVIVFGNQISTFVTPAPSAPTDGAVFCGDEVVGLAGPLNAAGRACFWAAWEQRRPAEFRTTRPTIEGDPITWLYRARADGIVEIVIDSRQDRYSNRDIIVLECRDLVRTDDPALPGPIEFGPGDGCVERQGP